MRIGSEHVNEVGDRGVTTRVGKCQVELVKQVPDNQRQVVTARGYDRG